MTRLHTLGLIGAVLALPACIIDTGLGETAEGDGSAGGSGSDGATDDEDPSATSGPPTATSDSEGGVTTDPTDTDGEGGVTTDPTDTDGEPGCEPGEDWVTWANDFSEPLAGIDPSFAAVLEGPCTLMGTFSGSPEGVSFEWEIYLECTMSGRFDGDAEVVDQAFMPVLRGSSALPLEQWLPFFEQDLRLRVVLSWWGMGWNRYAVLHRGDDIMLDLVSGERVDPRSGPFYLDDINALLGSEPWHGDIAVGVAESSCGSGQGECGEQPRAVELGWDGGDDVTLHAGQEGSFGTTVRELFYQVWVRTADDISEPQCTDTPLGDYQLALWAVEP